MKYIDADLLRKDIEKERKSIEGLFIEGDNNFYDGQDDAYNHTLALIDSLQQEQQDFPTTDEQMNEFLATHPKVEVPDKYKTPDWLFKKQEQREVDLEEEIEEYRMVNEWSESIPLNLFKVIARYFYGLGQLNSK